MPRIGLGTFQGNYDYSATTEVVVRTVKMAIDLGYRHIDTAEVYSTEEGIGIALKDKIQGGSVKREDLFVTTKLWSTSHRRELVVPTLRKSLQTLGLDYVDMYLIHWPCALKPGEDKWPKDENGNFIFEDDITDYTETWLGMVECKELGLARSIGVSNFNERQLKRLLNLGTLKPANVQIEVNPFFLNEGLVEFCKRENIQVTCFSPLHKPNREWAKPDDPHISTDPTLSALAGRHNKSTAQIALRFQLQRGLVVLPKSNSESHLKDNLSILDFELSPADMELIRANCGRHNHRVLIMEHLLGKSREFPFRE
jgi:aldehyde reductase